MGGTVLDDNERDEQKKRELLVSRIQKLQVFNEFNQDLLYYHMVKIRGGQVDYKQLTENIKFVRHSVINLLDFLTERIIRDLETKKRCKELDLRNTAIDNSSIISADNFFLFFLRQQERSPRYLFV